MHGESKIVVHEVSSKMLQYIQQTRQKYEVYLEIKNSEKEHNIKVKQIEITDEEIKYRECLIWQADKTI